MKHKWSEMIKAKADNMELVVFYKLGDQWRECPPIDAGVSPSFSDAIEYFLCHPKHKKECLHWLNGGEVEEDHNNRWDDIERHDWHDQSVFMFDDGFTILIKAKKVKRWVGVHRSGSTTMARESEDAVNAELLGDTGWSIHEIEIEQ